MRSEFYGEPAQLCDAGPCDSSSQALLITLYVTLFLIQCFIGEK